MNYELTLCSGALTRLRQLIELLEREQLYAVRTSLSRLRECGLARLERSDGNGDADERELWAVTVSNDGWLLLERGELSEGCMSAELHIDALENGRTVRFNGLI